MPREFSRTVRVAQTIKRAIAVLVSDWMRDRQFGMGSVTAVDVSPDMTQSRIYVSVYGSEDKSATLSELNYHSGRFRYLLSKEVRLRNIPALEFVLDESIEHGDGMSQMIGSLRSESQDG